MPCEYEAPRNCALVMDFGQISVRGTGAIDVALGKMLCESEAPQNCALVMDLGQISVRGTGAIDVALGNLEMIYEQLN